jgi:hypothetical protein
MNVRSHRRERLRGAGRHALRRTLVRKRWRDETNFLLRDPYNAKLLLDAVAEVNRWGAILDRPRERAHDDAA